MHVKISTEPHEGWLAAVMDIPGTRLGMAGFRPYLGHGDRYWGIWDPLKPWCCLWRVMWLCLGPNQDLMQVHA